jgi:glutamate synthase (NADPH/NADH) small chain
VSTKRFLGDQRGQVRGLEASRVELDREQGRPVFREVPGSEFTVPCELVLLAMGFLGPERPGMLEKLGVRLTERGTVWRDAGWMTSVPGVFAAGDMQRGQSLIVWAIAEGRSAAGGIDRYLMGRSDLPTPLP